MVGVPKIVTRHGAGYTLHLNADERQLVAHLLGEVRAMQTDPQAAEAVRRLFPVVHPEHPDREEEYQRLMRDELVSSRSEAIDAVIAVLDRPGRKVALDDAEMNAFAQAVNSVRLVLGTILDVTEDNEVDPPPALLESAEYQLYGYLSVVLDAAIRAMSGRL